MGAYTFTKHRPFELMGVSAAPFMDKDLYQGAYAEVTKRHYDYVVFPMTLTRENKDTLLLSYVFCSSSSFFPWLDCDVSVSLCQSYPSTAACLRSLTRHDV